MTDFEKIVKIVSECEAVSISKMKERCRQRDVKEARQIVAYLARKYTNRSYQYIADYFELNTHTNLIHAVKYIEGLLETDSVMRSRVERCEKLITLSGKIADIERTIEDMQEEMVKEMRYLIERYNMKVTNILKRA